MYNYRLARIDPISTLKHSIFLSVSVSIVFFVLDVLSLIVKVMISLFTHGKALIVLEQGGIQLFFTIFVLMLFSIGFGALCALLAFIYNYSSKWFDGINVHVEEYAETSVDESADKNDVVQ